MLEELKALIKLANIDIAARDIDAELREAPKRLSELQGDIHRLEELLSAERQQLEEAIKLFQAHEQEIKDQTQSLAKSKSKSAKARTMREVEAVEREMEVIRRTLKERETERERLKEAIDKRTAVLDNHVKEFKELVDLVSEEEKTSNQKLQELGNRKSQVLDGRDVEITKISSILIKRYDKIRDKREGIGVVAIKDDCCSGCNMVLTPQQVIAIQRAETMEQCPRCQRFIFDMETFNKEENPSSDESSPNTEELADS